MITIIPAIDIMDGHCVRLSKGEFSTRKTYSEDPLEVAKTFEDAGIRRLHVVDLDGAKNKKVVNWTTLERLSANTALDIDFGGGVQTRRELDTVFSLGVNQVTLGSISVKRPALIREWLEEFGKEKIIIAADFLDGMISVSGWREQTDTKLEEFIAAYTNAGFQTFLCTDISRDGMLNGPAFDTYARIKASLPNIHLLASGGISKIDDVTELDRKGIDGVIIGKALYEHNITLEQLEPFIC